MSTHLENTPSLRWLVLAASAAALVAALLFSSQIYFSMIDHGHEWWRLFLWQGACWGFWAAVSPWILRAGARLLQPSNRPRMWLVRLVALAVGTIAAHILVGAVALVILQPYLPIASYSFGQSVSRIVAAWLRADPIIFASVVATGYGLGGFWSARRRELRASRLEAQLAKSKLDALRLEIQPHFLFNTLNSIAAQVRAGANDQALDMIVGLSELLRTTLEHDGSPLVKLDEEIAFVERYLSLQEVRFGERLVSRFEIATDCTRAMVPFLLLQPLVENAITHGLSPRAEGGSLTVSAEREGDRLVLAVEDDGVGLPPDFSLEEVGIGIGNTRSKLAQVYGGDHQLLTVSGSAQGGTRVVISLPFELARNGRKEDAA